jgi:3-hydroxybutyrate dehydrogenase
MLVPPALVYNRRWQRSRVHRGSRGLGVPTDGREEAMGSDREKSSDSRPDPGTLAGRCALITGSVQGLGLAAARRFAAAGCHVMLNGFADERAITIVRRQLEHDYQVGVAYSAADLRHPGEIARLVTDATAAFGAVDILVNNAVVRHTAPIETFATEAWDESIAVNLSAAFHTIQLTLPAMKARNWGRIINVSSIYGVTAALDRVAYVTTKTALIGLTRAVALETTRFDITCNAICPGTTRTPVHEAAVSALMADGTHARRQAEATVLAGKQPTGRFVDADGVAALMVFLCQPDARDITGATLPVDGGWSAR